MRVAFVSIPHFPCAVEVLRAPRLRGRSVIVGDAEQAKRVFDCSPEAAECGVHQGMTIQRALALQPASVILAPDAVLYRRCWAAVVETLDAISPEIEDDGPGRAYVNVQGLQRLYADEEEMARRIAGAVESVCGIAPGVGVAGGKFPAVAAGAGGVRVLAPGSEAAFLAPRPVELLPVEAEVIFRLRLLGIEAIGDVARLTVPELQSQFGFEGKRLWQLANGIDVEPLRPRRGSEAIEAYVIFESPVAGVDTLVAVARQLLAHLRAPLRGRAARELLLQAELDTDRGWERRQVFREAVSEEARLEFLVRSALANFPPPRAVRSLSLRLSGLTGESGKQIPLGDRGRLQAQLEESIRHLKARYGYSPIYHCVDMEPWSVVPEDRQILVESDA